MGKAFSAFNGGCKFGNVNVGQTTARLGVTIGRGVCDITKADELFVDRRITGKVVLGLHNEGNGQKKLVEDVDYEISSTFDANGFRVSSESIGLGLTFKLKEIDIATLAKFSAKEGRLIITEVQQIPEDEKPEKADAEPGELKAEGPWRNVSIDDLFEPGKRIHKALLAADIKTVGQLADFTATDRWMTDIKGLGEKAVQDIEDRLMQFWQDNEVEQPVGAGA